MSANKPVQKEDLENDKITHDPKQTETNKTEKVQEAIEREERDKNSKGIECQLSEQELLSVN